MSVIIKSQIYTYNPKEFVKEYVDKLNKQTQFKHRGSNSFVSPHPVFEFEVDLIATAPGVQYNVTDHQGKSFYIDSPSKLPAKSDMRAVQEPWIELSISLPENYLGSMMKLMEEHSAEYVAMTYLTPKDIEKNIEANVLLVYNMPLSEMIVDLYDKIKSYSQR